MKAQTFSNEITDGTIRLAGSSRGILTANGVEIAPANAVKFYDRVDLEGLNRKVFLVEHAAAFCAIHGVQSATILGVNTQWDSKRPSHQEAKTNGYEPSDVLGRPDGTVWQLDIPTVKREYIDVDRLVVAPEKEVTFTDSANETTASVFPARLGDDVTVQVKGGGFSAEIVVSFEDGVTNFEHRKRLLTSRSLAVLGIWTEESVWHALADVVGDVIGLGRIWGHIDVQLGFYYHAATVGLAKQVFSSGL